MEFLYALIGLVVGFCFGAWIIAAELKKPCPVCEVEATPEAALSDAVAYHKGFNDGVQFASEEVKELMNFQSH